MTKARSVVNREDQGPLSDDRAREIADRMMIRIRKERRSYVLYLTPDGAYRIGPVGGGFALSWSRLFPNSLVGTYNGDASLLDVIADLLDMDRKQSRPARERAEHANAGR